MPVVAYGAVVIPAAGAGLGSHAGHAHALCASRAIAEIAAAVTPDISSAGPESCHSTDIGLCEIIALEEERLA